MAFLTLLGIAIGLAMDAFAVALGAGLTLERADARSTIRLAWHFGLFQALMPILGWLAGLTVAKWISPFDHWIAFGLLTFIGGKMIYEALHDDEDAARADPTKGWTLVILSVATSIDALAVGLSLAFLRISIWYPAVVIGIVAALFTAVGMQIGKRVGALFGRRVEIIGGLVLVGIGVKVLVDHLLK